MTHEALGIGRGGLLFMVDTEALGVKGGLHVSGVAGRLNKARDCSRVAGPAIGHTELRRDLLRGVVAIHAIEHLGQRQVRKTGAARNRIVTSRAIDPILLLSLKMRDVRELDIDVLARNHVLSDHPAALGETGILDLFRRVTAAATLGIESRAQVRLDAGLGVANGAFGVPRESSVNPVRLKLVAEGAISPKTGGRINAGLLVYMLGVRILKQNRARIPIPREWHQIRLPAGRERAVALGADDLLDLFFEIVRVAGLALIVTRTLQHHRAFLDRHVAHAAFQSVEFPGVESVDEKFRGRGRLGLRRLRFRNARCGKSKGCGEEETRVLIVSAHSAQYFQCNPIRRAREFSRLGLNIKKSLSRL